MCVLGSIELGYFPMYKRHLNVLHMQRLTSFSLNHSYGFWDLTWFKKPTSPCLCWHIYHARNVLISNLLISALHRYLSCSCFLFLGTFIIYRTLQNFIIKVLHCNLWLFTLLFHFHCFYATLNDIYMHYLNLTDSPEPTK